MRKIVMVGAVIAAVLPFMAHAAGDDSGWYGGVGIGRADLGNIYFRGPGQMNTFEYAKTGYKLFGGHQFNTNFALEGGYVDFGTHKGSGADEHGFTNPVPDSWKFSAYTIAAVGILPLGGDFSVFGKAGVALAKMGEYDSDGTTAINRNQSLLLGVGVKYGISKVLFLRAEYESFGKVGDPSGGPQATGQFKPNMLSGSIGAKF